MKTNIETTIRLPSALKHNRAAEVGFHRSVDHALRTVASSDAGIKELLSKIERKLPNVAEASEDLQALRGLFELQLVGARTLQSQVLFT
jgi:alkyl sulfatase BDS1-like metallo-beta-lactamase superfamily hydrolase